MILTFEGTIDSPSWIAGQGEASRHQQVISSLLLSRSIGIQSVFVDKPDAALSVANWLRSVYPIQIQTISPNNENPYRVLELLTTILSEEGYNPKIRFVTNKERQNQSSKDFEFYLIIAAIGLASLAILKLKI